jgi:F-type H+-transporting ATPase subunit epsilon|tara:strand:- start:112 stop:504 length:393 start_codon:yes stop_codon:yes gene_type:complete
MNEIFNLEIISPDKTLVNFEVKQVTIPAFEGLMTILKDHISIITFLRPGFIELETADGREKFYAEDGVVEFYKNNLLILSSTIKNKKNFSSDEINKMLDESKIQINKDSIKDKKKYILSYKISTLRELSQ